jgi:hypothetical protein
LPTCSAKGRRPKTGASKTGSGLFTKQSAGHLDHAGRWIGMRARSVLSVRSTRQRSRSILHAQPELGAVAAQPAEPERHLGGDRLLAAQQPLLSGPSQTRSAPGNPAPGPLPDMSDFWRGQGSRTTPWPPFRGRATRRGSAACCCSVRCWPGAAASSPPQARSRPATASARSSDRRPPPRPPSLSPRPDPAEPAHPLRARSAARGHGARIAAGAPALRAARARPKSD